MESTEKEAYLELLPKGFNNESVDGRLTFFGTLRKFFTYASKPDIKTIADDWNEDSTLRSIVGYVYTMILENMSLRQMDKALDDYTDEDYDQIISRIKDNKDYKPGTIKSFRRNFWRVYKAAVDNIDDFQQQIFWDLKASDISDNENDLSNLNNKEAKLLLIPRSIKPAEEIAIIKEFTNMDWITEDGRKIGLAMQFFTGTRNNEVCGMNYGDIRDDMYSDRSWHSVLITRSTKLKSSETKLGGKTRNAIRVIHLFEFIFDRLMQRKAHIQKLIDSGQIILPDGTNSINDLPIANAVIKNGQQISNDYTGRLSSVDLSLYGRSFFDNRVEASKSGILAEVLMIMNNNNVYAEELNPTTYLLRRNFATRMHNLSLSDSDQLYILGHAIEDEKESRNTLSNRDALERMYSAFLKHPYYTVVKKLTSGTEMEEAGSPSAVVAVRSREKAANTVKISLDEPYEKIDIVFKDSIQNCKAVLSSQINHTVSEKVDVTRPVNEAYFAKTKR